MNNELNNAMELFSNIHGVAVKTALKWASAVFPFISITLIDLKTKAVYSMSVNSAELANFGGFVNFREGETKSCPADWSKALPRLSATDPSDGSGGNRRHRATGGFIPPGRAGNYHLRFLPARQAYMR